ncbi:hypothetical protein PNIG_a3607 [Pseudoalteromonas nigrifaciens]|uniref:Uncharacterized protein n=1 Tax=Pseudoalteromonas nigrifaciens TaxID=28109 RepID=A0AAC9UMH2_9GAMM|nr:hypothetical protein PNIG_a3607 [Pseudoalteromonas nigrifaciens]
MNSAIDSIFVVIQHKMLILIDSSWLVHSYVCIIAQNTK